MRFYVLLLAALICGQLIVAQNHVLKGLVVDQSTGEPLIGAIIHLENKRQAVSTDSEGRYIFPTIASGKQSIQVSYIGYITQRKELEIKDQLTLVDFSLSPQATSLSEIVVTGTGTEHYIKDAPVQTEVISGRALKEYTGRDIEDVLGGLSASFTYHRGDMGSNIQLNGLKNDYILILVDGKRMNGDVGGQNDLNRINMNNLERIEIVKGAVSSLYGSDAIGGVIHFISKKHKDKLSVSNTTRVGEYADINQNNHIIFNHGKWSSNTSFAYRHTDGWKNTSQEWYRGRLIENSVTKTINRSSNYSVSEDLSYQASDKLLLSAQASFYEKWTNRPTGVPQWRLNDFYYRNQSVGAAAKYNLPGKNYLALDVSFDRYDYFYDYTHREYTDYFDEHGDRIVYYPGERILQTSQRRVLSNLKGVFYLDKNNTLNTGVEYIWDKLISPFRLQNDKATAYSLSAYVQDEWNITKKLNITAGIRLGHHREFGQTFTPKISAMYKWKYVNLRGTYSNGFKAPTIKELYYSYQTTIMSKFKAYYGNTALKPQKSDYYALNLEYHRPSFKASITGYYNQIRHMISLQSTTTSYEDKLQHIEETMKYVNLAKGRTYGIDFTFETTLPLHIKMGGGYSFLLAKGQRTDDEEAKDYMKYVNINGTSRHNATFRVSWAKSWEKYKLGVSINGRYQSKRYYITEGNTKPYQIWRLNTSHELLNTKKWKLDMNAGIDNLFNYIDRTPFGHNRGTTSPGRNYYVSLILKFQNQS